MLRLYSGFVLLKGSNVVCENDGCATRSRNKNRTIRLKVEKNGEISLPITSLLVVVASRIKGVFYLRV